MKIPNKSIDWLENALISLEFIAVTEQYKVIRCRNRSWFDHRTRKFMYRNGNSIEMKLKFEPLHTFRPLHLPLPSLSVRLVAFGTSLNCAIAKIISSSIRVSFQNEAKQLLFRTQFATTFERMWESDSHFRFSNIVIWLIKCYWMCPNWHETLHITSFEIWEKRKKIVEDSQFTMK